MTIAIVLTSFAHQHIDGINAWYSWRGMKSEELPEGIELPVGNGYQQNVSLKQQLHALWVGANAKRRRELTEYYVATWGGIRSNRSETMTAYSRETPAQLIGRGVQGVASWSKVLCMHDPNTYAIYDARVAVALNALLLLGGENFDLFPLVPSRNVAVAKGIELLKAMRRSRGFQVVPHESFYSEYLLAARTAANSVDAHLCAVEMLLFSKAPELAAGLESCRGKRGRPILCS